MQYAKTSPSPEKQSYTASTISATVPENIRSEVIRLLATDKFTEAKRLLENHK